MRPIEKYVEAMENKDFAGLAELFTPDGILWYNSHTECHQG